MEGVDDNENKDLLGETTELKLVSNEVMTASSSKNESCNEGTVPVKQTVIRLKRRIEDSPSKILVVSYKRQKTDFNKGIAGVGCVIDAATTSASVEDDPVCSQILRLVGTVAEDKSDNNNIAATVRNIIGAGGSNAGTAGSGSSDVRLPFRKTIKAKTSNITEKAREKFKRNTEENRFKIVASRRGVSDQHENALEQCEAEIDLLKLLDLVPENEIDAECPKKKVRPEGFEPGNVTCNGMPMIKDVSADEKGFVYDLYLSNDPCIEEFMCGQFLSVEEGDGDWEFGEYRDKVEDEHFMEDDEDSNAEDNWRNDYPDSEEEGVRDSEHRYVYEAAGEDSDEHVDNVLKGLNLKGDSSSDDDVIYGIHDDNDGLGFDHRYSRYKRRVMEEYEDEVVSASDSDYD